MSAQDAGTRQDLIENGVQRELLPLQEGVTALPNLKSNLLSEVEHDLIVWPREYLETYLDRGKNGIIPLNEVQLQDILEAALDRDEELARNALSSLKKATAERTSATLTVSMDNEASDRAAHPVLVERAAASDGREFEYLLRVENDPQRKALRALFEKTAGIVEKRARLETLSTPTTTHAHATRWYANSKTWDRGSFIDTASEPTVAIQAQQKTDRPGIFESLKAFCRRLLQNGLQQNSREESSRANPEFRKENLQYVAQYEPDGATVRVHDKRSVEDERVVGLRFDEPSADGVQRIGIATEKDLQQKMDKDQSSARSAISQLSESLQAATGRAELVRQQRQAALTDSGVYLGKIISETPELVVQRISAATEVAHPKSLFAETPQIGQLVRIAYHNNVASIRELQPRKQERELVR